MYTAFIVVGEAASYLKTTYILIVILVTFLNGNATAVLIKKRPKGLVTLRNFLSNLSRNAPHNEKQEECTYVVVKTAVKLRDKLLEWRYTVKWYYQLLQSVLSIAPIYFVQRFAQQKHCETTHVTLCNSPATCRAMALRDKLLRKLHSVTGP